MLPSSSSCSEGQFASSSSTSSASSASSSPRESARLAWLFGIQRAAQLKDREHADISFFTSSSNTSSESSAADHDCPSLDSSAESGSSPDEPSTARAQQQQQQQPSRRRHYREKQVREFEGRDSPSLVWVCSKAPRSPLPGAVITPSEEDMDYFHSSSHLLAPADKRVTSPAKQSDISAKSDAEVALRLARAPKYVPSENSSSVDLCKLHLNEPHKSGGGQSTDPVQQEA